MSSTSAHVRILACASKVTPANVSLSATLCHVMSCPEDSMSQKKSLFPYPPALYLFLHPLMLCSLKLSEGRWNDTDVPVMDEHS